MRTWLSALLAAMVLGAWLLSASGRPLPLALNRAILLAAGAALALFVVRWVVRSWRGAEVDRRPGQLLPDSRVLLVLTGVAFVLRYVALDFELVNHWYNDEGTFLATARKINEGKLLPTAFTYSHLLHYMSAVGLWVQDCFPTAFAKVLGTLYHAPDRLAQSALLLRLIVATLGALTTVPTFLMARSLVGSMVGSAVGSGVGSQMSPSTGPSPEARLGSVAAAFAGALIALAPLHNELSHFSISDVPSALFAALACWKVARLLDGENLPDYLWAGVFAGLAAATKYPAGVSAVAIVGVWVYWRIRRRDFNLLLLWSGLASLATLLLVMPALWLTPEIAFAGRGTDAMSGVRIYAGGRGSTRTLINVQRYGEELVSTFGAPAIALGLSGLALLPSWARRRAASMLPFPVVFLVLICAMGLFVDRTLAPILPVMAALLGAGLSAWPGVLARFSSRAGRWALPVLAVLALTLPALASISWDYRRTGPGTFRLTTEWVEQNVPAGAGIIKEYQTPKLDLGAYNVKQIRFAGAMPVEELLAPEWDYLILSQLAYGRYSEPEPSRYRPQEHHREIYLGYQRLFELERVFEIRPGGRNAGPALSVYRLDPERVVYREARHFRPRDVTHYSHAHLAPGRKGDPIRFTRRGQSVTLKAHLQPGRYRLRLQAKPRDVQSWVHVVTRDNRVIGTLETDRPQTIELPSREKYFFRVFVARRGRLQGVRIERLPAAGLEATGNGQGPPD